MVALITRLWAAVEASWDMDACEYEAFDSNVKLPQGEIWPLLEGSATSLHASGSTLRYADGSYPYFWLKEESNLSWKDEKDLSIQKK